MGEAKYIRLKDEQCVFFLYKIKTVDKKVFWISHGEQLSRHCALDSVMSEAEQVATRDAVCTRTYMTSRCAPAMISNRERGLSADTPARLFSAHSVRDIVAPRRVEGNGVPGNGTCWLSDSADCYRHRLDNRRPTLAASARKIWRTRVNGHLCHFLNRG